MKLSEIKELKKELLDALKLANDDNAHLLNRVAQLEADNAALKREIEGLRGEAKRISRINSRGERHNQMDDLLTVEEEDCKS